MGYPVAYYLCRTEAKVKHILTALALLPLWVPITVRLFGMMAILETGTLFAVEMGLVYCGLPYMIIVPSTQAIHTLTTAMRTLSSREEVNSAL